jgi:hypothetical protein
VDYSGYRARKTDASLSAGRGRQPPRCGPCESRLDRPGAGSDADDVKAELLRLPAVAAVQGAAATTDTVDARMEQFNEILLTTVAIAGAMALLIAFDATFISVTPLTYAPAHPLATCDASPRYEPPPGRAGSPSSTC